MCSIKSTGEHHCVLVLKELEEDYILDLHTDRPIELLDSALKRLDPIAMVHNRIWCDVAVEQ